MAGGIPGNFGDREGAADVIGRYLTRDHFCDAKNRELGPSPGGAKTVPWRENRVLAVQQRLVQLGNADLPDLDFGPIRLSLFPGARENRQAFGSPIALDQERQGFARTLLHDLRHFIPGIDALVCDLNNFVAAFHPPRFRRRACDDGFDRGGEIGKRGHE